MEPVTAQELMEIQSALEEESELSCYPDEPGDQSTTFKRPLSCYKCGKAFITKSNLKIHERMR